MKTKNKQFSKFPKIVYSVGKLHKKRISRKEEDGAFISCFAKKYKHGFIFLSRIFFLRFATNLMENRTKITVSCIRIVEWHIGGAHLPIENAI